MYLKKLKKEVKKTNTVKGHMELLLKIWEGEKKNDNDNSNSNSRNNSP